MVHNVKRGQALYPDHSNDALLRRGGRHGLQLQLDGLRKLSQRGSEVSVVVLVYGGELAEEGEEQRE